MTFNKILKLNNASQFCVAISHVYSKLIWKSAFVSVEVCIEDHKSYQDK